MMMIVILKVAMKTKKKKKVKDLRKKSYQEIPVTIEDNKMDVIHLF